MFELSALFCSFSTQRYINNMVYKCAYMNIYLYSQTRQDILHECTYSVYSGRVFAEYLCKHMICLQYSIWCAILNMPHSEFTVHLIYIIIIIAINYQQITLYSGGFLAVFWQLIQCQKLQTSEDKNKVFFTLKPTNASIFLISTSHPSRNSNAHLGQ